MHIGKLKNNTPLLDKLEDSYLTSTQNVSSQYWSTHVGESTRGDEHLGQLSRIKAALAKEGLSGFGTNPDTTFGFGDASKFNPRPRLRRLIKIPVVYKMIEKYSVIYSINKYKNSFFACYKKIFKDLNFVHYMFDQLTQSTKNLKIRCAISLEGKLVPRRSLFFLINLEKIKVILKRANSNLELRDILDGNYMDIGGAYGGPIDVVHLYKKFHKIGKGSISYVLEQFPVSYVANQYLEYRHEGDILPPTFLDNEIIPTDISKTDETAGIGSHSFLRIIQNTSAKSSSGKSSSGLDINFFFNSNSFQEMDDQQIIDYCEFMKKNKSKRAFLGVCFYLGGATAERAISILNENFKCLGKITSKDFLEINDINELEIIADPNGVSGKLVDDVVYLFEL